MVRSSAWSPCTSWTCLNLGMDPWERHRQGTHEKQQCLLWPESLNACRMKCTPAFNAGIFIDEHRESVERLFNVAAHLHLRSFLASMRSPSQSSSSDASLTWNVDRNIRLYRTNILAPRSTALNWLMVMQHRNQQGHTRQHFQSCSHKQIAAAKLPHTRCVTVTKSIVAGHHPAVSPSIN